MIKLTTYKTGEPIFIDPDTIRAIVQLPREKSHLSDIYPDRPDEWLERRTRVHYAMHDFTVIVSEEATEIMRLIEDPNPQPHVAK